MPISISSNSAANVARRNLIESSDRLTNSTTKLSSGKRVFSASEDAAAVSVGTGVRINVAAFRTAQTNTTQGLAMLQIAEGAMGQVSDIITRMQVLSVQASAGNLSNNERSLLNNEFTNLKDEIDRIANDTEFNGTQLVSGGDAQVDVQEADPGNLFAQGLTLEFEDSLITSGDAFKIVYDSTTEQMTLYNLTTGENIDQDITQLLDATATIPGNDLSVGQTVRVRFPDLGVVVNLNGGTNGFARGTDLGGEGTVAPADISNITVNGSIDNLYQTTGGVDNNDITTLAGLVDAQGNIPINFNSSGGGNLTLAGNAGLEFSVDGGAFAAAPGTNLDDGGTHTIAIRLAGGAELGTLTLDDVDGTGAAGTINFKIGETIFGETTSVASAVNTFRFQVGTGTDLTDAIDVSVQAITTAALGIDTEDIGTQAGAQSAIDALDAALSDISASRALLGASQSQLEFTSANLSIIIENSEKAKSALLDVDVAQEITELSNSRALVEAGVAMLSNANLQPNALLRLLEGA